MADDRRKVEDTIARKKASRDWLQANFWEEWAEVFRFYKARTEPIIDPVTKQEDLTRTNICGPEYWTIGRKKGARLSSRPPTLDVRAKTPIVGQVLSAFTRLQWDKAQEQKHQKRHSLQAQLFGLSIKDHWYDEIAVVWPFRKRPQEVLGRFGVVENQGPAGGGFQQNTFRAATEEEHENGKSRPFRDLDETLQADVLAGIGPELVEPERLVKYSGPVSSFVFLGDFYPEPEFETLHTAAWLIFEKKADLEWLAYFAKRKYVDPNTGQERPVFNPKAVIELADEDSWAQRDRSSSDELKERLRSVIYKNRPEFDVKLIPGKRFLITSEHTFRDGWPWIRWIGNEKVFLGEMPYPWDLQGRYAVSSLTPIPDLLTGVGDSSPRILRHMMRLGNVGLAQAVDLVTNVAKVLLRKRPGADFPAEITDRGLFRIIEMEKGDLEPLLQGVGVEAFASAAQNISMIFRKMQLGEPALTDFGEQSQAQPDTQKRATIALLQSRVSESLSQDELEQLNESLAEETTIKLLMKQQMGQEEIMEKQFFNVERLQEAVKELGSGPGVIEELFERHPTFMHGISMHAGGMELPRKVRIDWMELQEDFEVFPELGSTLAADDQMKKAEADEIYLTALTAPPGIWNVRAAARMKAQTYKGARAEDLILPEPEPQPQLPDAKVNISLSGRDLGIDKKPVVQDEILRMAGLTPPADAPLRETLQGIKDLSEAADAAKNLAAGSEDEEVTAS